MASLAEAAVIGQNLDAGRMDRVRQAWHDGLLFCATFTVAMTAIPCALRGPVVTFFQGRGGERTHCSSCSVARWR